MCGRHEMRNPLSAIIQSADVGNVYFLVKNNVTYFYRVLYPLSKMLISQRTTKCCGRKSWIPLWKLRRQLFIVQSKYFDL